MFRWTTTFLWDWKKKAKKKYNNSGPHSWEESWRDSLNEWNIAAQRTLRSLPRLLSTHWGKASGGCESSACIWLDELHLKGVYFAPLSLKGVKGAQLTWRILEQSFSCLLLWMQRNGHFQSLIHSSFPEHLSKLPSGIAFYFFILRKTQPVIPEWLTGFDNSHFHA